MGMQPQPPTEALEEAPQDETEEPQPKRQKKGPVSELLCDLSEQQSQSCSHSDKVEKELNLYKAEQPADLDSNPLAWWKEQKSLYSLMSKLVQKVFSYVATSILSERVFSASGNVITKKCNCLTSEHADQLIFLFENSKQLLVYSTTNCTFTIDFTQLYHCGCSIIATLQFHL